jgi:hypothetical protein
MDLPLQRLIRLAKRKIKIEIEFVLKETAVGIGLGRWQVDGQAVANRS